MNDELIVSAELKLQALQPYLEQLAAALEAAGEGPLRVESAGQVIEATRWEVEALRLVFQPEEGQFPELDAVLVAEGLALRLKVAADLEALAAAGVSMDESGESAAVSAAAGEGAGAGDGASDDAGALDELSAFLSGDESEAPAQPDEAVVEAEEGDDPSAAADTGEVEADEGDDPFAAADTGEVEADEGDDPFAVAEAGEDEAEDGDDPFAVADTGEDEAEEGDDPFAVAESGEDRSPAVDAAAGDVFDVGGEPAAQATADDVFDLPTTPVAEAVGDDVFSSPEAAPAPVEAVAEDGLADPDPPPLDVGLEDSGEHRIAGEDEPFPAEVADPAGASEEAPAAEPGQVAPELLEQLALDAAVGAGLMVDIQRVMNALVGGGQLEAANQLTKFRHNIRHDITRVQRTLDALVEPEEEELRQRAAMAYRWDAETQDVELSDAERTKAAGAARRKQRREEIKRILVAQKRRIAVMAAVAVALAVAWAVFIWLPSTRQVKIEELTLTDFSGIPQIIAVEARPPSIFITVSRKRWDRMNAEGKLKMISSVGFILARSEYTGAFFRDDRGQTVGEWFKGGTARVIEPPPPSTKGT